MIAIFGFASSRSCGTLRPAARLNAACVSAIRPGSSVDEIELLLTYAATIVAVIVTSSGGLNCPSVVFRFFFDQNRVRHEASEPDSLSP